MIQNNLNFQLTKKNGDYGIIFQDSEPVAFAMFNKEDFSLSVAFKTSLPNEYSKGDILTTVLLKTGNLYGLNDYSVIVNDYIFNAYSQEYAELNN
jgi:hypothetical protein